MYTDDFLKELITCSKTITDSPKNVGVNRGSYKTIFSLSSLDGKFNFSGFITVNTYFQENFSIGLVYIPKEEKGKICLLRCNGLHGEIKDIPHHSFFHIHYVSAEDLNNGIKVERNIKRTVEYSSLESAIQFFIRYVNISKNDRNIYFPPPSGQIEFPF